MITDEADGSGVGTEYCSARNRMMTLPRRPSVATDNNVATDKNVAADDNVETDKNG